MLDLRPLVIEIGDQVGGDRKGRREAPGVLGKVAIIEESQLETAQTATKILRAVADWMWLVALAVAALAIWLARGRRRLELRALAIGLLVVGLLMLAVRRFAGDYLVDALAKDDAVKPAAHDAWRHPHAGPGRPRLGVDHPRRRHARRSLVRRRHAPRRARRAAPPRPSCESRPTTYAIAAVALLVLVLVAPPIARGWLTALVLIALVVAGIEVVRAIALRATPRLD